MAVPTDPSLLAQAAACMSCVPRGMEQEIMIYLLQQIAGNTQTTDQLMESAKCIKCVPAGSQPEVIIYLLISIANAVGA